MKKLYIISYYFAPLGRADGINRTYLSKFLAEKGWNIEVISCHNPKGLLRNFQKDEKLLNILPNSVKINPIPNHYGRINELFSLMQFSKDPFPSWIEPAIRQGEKIISKRGIIYAIAPPVTNVKVAAKLAKKAGLPLVIDFRDDDFTLNKRHVQQAESIIASTKRSLKNMLEFYAVDSQKGEVIYNGYAVKTSSTKKIRKDNELTIIYSGLLNHSQHPIMLIKALRNMEERYPETKGKVKINYYGPRNYYTSLFLKRYLNQKIQFHGYIPFQEVLKKIEQSDVAYTSLTKWNEYCIPSKVFQYISMNTPLLGTGPYGALSDFITKHNFGKFSHWQDIDAQTDDIYSFLLDKHSYNTIVNNLANKSSNYSMKTQACNLDIHLQKILKANDTKKNY